MIKTVSFIFSTIIVILISCNSANNNPIIITEWHFSPGDDAAWANSRFDDVAWGTIKSGNRWEFQGFFNYDGYAWYRASFHLPTEMKAHGIFNDTLQIYLGQIDDCDETYLNGKLIGKNGRAASPGDKTDFLAVRAYDRERYYTLSVDDPRINWGEENVIAIRVYDFESRGGLHTGIPEISMRDVKDYVAFQIDNNPLMQPDSTYIDHIRLINRANFVDLKGELSITVLNTGTGVVVSKEQEKVLVRASGDVLMEHKLPEITNERYVVTYEFTEAKSHYHLKQTRELKYILTPKQGSEPRINGPKVTSARPGNPFLYRVPVTGMKPLHYAAINLHEGLCIDNQTGIIEGSVKLEGEYSLTLTVQNDFGKASRNLKIVIGEQLCLTPPMGWNSWNCWGLNVDAEKMMSTVDRIVETGLADHGWCYVNIDDGWPAPVRKPNGEIETNEKFGNMNELSDYVHSKGLKLGIYTSPGKLTCGKYMGSYQHELQDVKTFEAWGIDYLKYDWCSYSEICEDINSISELTKPYNVMRDALRQVNRDIVYSLCQYGMGKVWEWGGKVDAQLWRTTDDIRDNWESMTRIGFGQVEAAKYAKPGNWNDPDMLVVGYVGWGRKLHPSNLTPSEQYAHLSLWSLLSAPLLLGCDLTQLDDFTLNLLTNDEVIEINQDEMGIQAIPIHRGDGNQVYTKDLADGSKAVGLFNLGDYDAMLSVDWKSLGFSGKKLVRDVWRQKNLGEYESVFQSVVPAHGVVMVKIMEPWQ